MLQFTDKNLNAIPLTKFETIFIELINIAKEVKVEWSFDKFDWEPDQRMDYKILSVNGFNSLENYREELYRITFQTNNELLLIAKDFEKETYLQILRKLESFLENQKGLINNEYELICDYYTDEPSLFKVKMFKVVDFVGPLAVDELNMIPDIYFDISDFAKNWLSLVDRILSQISFLMMNIEFVSSFSINESKVPIEQQYKINTKVTVDFLGAFFQLLCLADIIDTSNGSNEDFYRKIADTFLSKNSRSFKPDSFKNSYLKSRTDVVKELKSTVRKLLTHIENIKPE